MTPHCGNANEFLDGSAAARWERERRIHQIVILSGRFRVERLPGTLLQSWDVQFRIAQFLTAGSRSCVSGAQGCYCCSWPYLDQQSTPTTRKISKNSSTTMFGCSFQRWPSTSWSTFSMITVETQAKQSHVAKSCYVWSTATWCTWISKGARWFRPLRGRICAVPAGPIWEKQTSHGASSCKFGCVVWPVCWNAMFFFSNVKAIVTAVSLTAFGNIDRPKMWNRQVQMVGLAKVTCKRSGNRLPSFYRLPR